jgi:uncharacterized Zn finger protein
MSWGYSWRPYVPVARRKSNARAYAVKLAKKEKRDLAPVVLAGRTIAGSFWGKAWCENLEQYSDFANRLPRGRTYVRNGSVIDLQIERGKVKAIVSGSEVYRVTIDIKTVPAPKWSRIKNDCARSVDSLIDLLQGRFDQGIMQRLTERETGLFPHPKEIKMACSCPDWAGMCKHVAATLYGVGARLDSAPELLFTLRDVDHLELIGEAVDADNLSEAFQGEKESALSGSDLGEIFGIDIEGTAQPDVRTPEAPAAKARPRANPKPVGAAKRGTSTAAKKAIAPKKKRKASARS